MIRPMNARSNPLLPRLQFPTCKFGSRCGEIFCRAAITALLMASILAFLTAVGVVAPGMAQDWPTKTVRIIVPFGPGSTPDMVARLLGDRVQQKLGASFVIENKAGASGNLGTDAVAKAEPDGSTLGISIGGPLAINTLLFSKLPYDPAKDIAPIT